MEVVSSKGKLVIFDLESIYPADEIIATIDISQHMREGIVLIEDEFRKSLENINFSTYRGKYVSIFCSTEAIVPSWAYLVITSFLSNYTNRVVIGKTEKALELYYFDILNKYDYSDLEGEIVLLRGCSKKELSPQIFSFAVNKLIPHVKKLIFGEVCSSVPIYKK